MLNLITTWLTPKALRLAGTSAALAAALAVLLGAKQAGRCAEKVEQYEKLLEIKNAQLRAAYAAPHTRRELVDRLRTGKF